MYDDWSDRVEAAAGENLPTFDEFWDEGQVRMPGIEKLTLLGAFREDPDGSPLQTPSGKIEIGSETIGSFGYDDCRDYPSWFDVDTLRESGSYPLRLVANNPARDCTASSIWAGTASRPRSRGVSRCGFMSGMRKLAGSRPATSSCCAATRAVAWPARW